MKEIIPNNTLAMNHHSRAASSDRSSVYFSASASTSPSRSSPACSHQHQQLLQAAGKTNGRVNLFRSRSEGNLAGAGKKQQQQRHDLNTPLDRCIRAIYGSWRNLMQRKSDSPYASKCAAGRELWLCTARRGKKRGSPICAVLFFMRARYARDARPSQGIFFGNVVVWWV